MLDRLSAITGVASRVLIGAAIVGLVAITAVISWQVFARYVLNNSPSWAEQAALLIMNWMVMAAAAAGVREGFHIRIGAGADNAGRLAPAIRIAAHLVVAFVGAGFIVWGSDLVATTWSHVIPTLGVPRGVAYAPFPIAGALFVVFALEHVAAELTGRGGRPWS